MLHTPALETQVHSYTTGDQHNATATALANGGWVVTWTSDGQDGDGSGVYQQAYNADGTTAGDETRVNSYTTSLQDGQQIAALADGGWVVTWTSDGQDGTELLQRVFNSDGTERQGDMRVNTYTGGGVSSVVAALDDGGWVVAWETSNPADDDDAPGYYQQVYNANGTARGGEVHVNTTPGFYHDDLQVTALDGGGWVATWKSRGQDNHDNPDGYDGIYQQAYNQDGTKLGSETQVNSYTTDSQSHQQVAALTGGGWVVTWQSDGQDPDGSAGIYQQAYNANGTTHGGETRVNATSEGGQLEPDIAALADGGWVVAWTTYSDVRQQAYNADGTTRDSETLVNTDTSNTLRAPEITALQDGGWVVIWQTQGPAGLNWGIHQQAFNADGTALGGETQVNTYTGSFQETPEVTVLADGGWVVTWDVQVEAGYPGISQDGDGDGVYQQRYATDGTVYGSNHAPSAADKTVSLLEDHSFMLSAANFGFSDITDGDVFSSVIITTLPGNGTLKLNGAAVIADQEIDVSELSHLVWKPSKNADGIGLATIEFTVTDDGGTAGNGKDTSGIHTLTFDVTAVSDAPVGADKTVTIKEDHAYAFKARDFGLTDAEGESDHLSAIVISTLPGAGKLTLDGAKVHVGDVIAKADLADLVWTPAKNANGDALATLRFKVMDDGGTANGGHDTATAANRFTFNVSEVTDVFKGSAAAETLKGTAGDDFLDGKGGNDRLTGLAGSDTFTFANSYGRDTITDFAATGKDHDVIDLSRLESITSFSDLKTNHISQHGQDVWIDGGNGDVLVLKATDIGDLGKADFAF
jgi:hypothetical protein